MSGGLPHRIEPLAAEEMWTGITSNSRERTVAQKSAKPLYARVTAIVCSRWSLLTATVFTLQTHLAPKGKDAVIDGRAGNRHSGIKDTARRRQPRTGSEDICGP